MSCYGRSMPIYEYKCEDCGKVVDRYFAIGQAPPEFAWEEGEEIHKFRRVYRLAGIFFKGSGFHSTDYGPKHE